MAQMPYSAPIPGMGLPAEYSEQLFSNLQALNRGQRAASRQGIMDNSRNPAFSGVQQMMLRQNDQQFADQALNQGTQAQLQGVQEGLTDRRAQQQRDWTSSENQLNRDLSRWQTQAGIDQAKWSQVGQQYHSNDVANRKMVGSLLGGAAGMLGGPVFGALGAGAGSWVANQFGGGGVNGPAGPPPPIY